MKKVRIAGMVLGVFALAASAVGTYAWFTADGGSATIKINAATIKVQDATLGTAKGDQYLPGETMETGAISIKNTGTRAALVELTPTLSAIDGEEAAIDNERLGQIIKDLGFEFTETAAIKQILVEAENGPAVNKLYVLIKAGESLPENLAVTMQATLTGEFGGNYKENNDERSVNKANEQNSEFTFGYTAIAVQATSDAVADYFGQNVADAFENALNGLTIPEAPVPMP